CVIRSGVLTVVEDRPSKQQHLCADRGYDYADVHEFVLDEGYIAHIKQRRRRGEPAAAKGDVPGEAGFPARRWVVERTFSWLLKRRSIRTRWCKKAENWLALVQFACAHILCDMAIYG
ncbi:MAG TPA: transposase, partial [Roseiflexaceae bacterium]|nr:transposase [Roseiflexaceae bacterium]